MFDFAGPEYEIDILSVGPKTSQRGQKVNFSSGDLQEIADSYSPDKFRAPLIVTSPAHSTAGVADQNVHAQEFAYGTPDRLKVDGSKLKAVFTKISPKFRDWVKQGSILNVSSSIYPRSHAANPSPGKYSLRHIAGLGATPPADKNLAALSLSEFQELEDDADAALAFSQFELGSDDGCLEFSDDWAIAELFSNLRDMMIDEKGLEAADRYLPKYLVNMLKQEAIEEKLEASDYSEESPEPPQETQTGTLEEPSEEPQGPLSHSETKMDEQQLQEQQSALDQRAQELDAREAEIRRAGFESFCETELKGRLTPAIASHAQVCDFMEHLASTSMDPLSFGEGEAKQTPLQFFQGMLKALPVAVELGEVVDSTSTPVELSEADEAEEKAKAYYLKQSGVE